MRIALLCVAFTGRGPSLVEVTYKDLTTPKSIELVDFTTALITRSGTQGWKQIHAGNQ